MRRLFAVFFLLLAVHLRAFEKNPSDPVSEMPQLPLEVYSGEFAEILGKEPKLIHLAKGFGFTEGPAYVSLKEASEGYLLFTDQVHKTSA